MPQDRHFATVSNPATILRDPLMAKAKGRVELQADEDWIAAVDHAAEVLGISRSDFIRIACREKILRDGNEPLPQPPVKPSHPGNQGRS